MIQAPNRGTRKCETCIHFTDMRSEWNGTPNLKWDDPGYRSPTYIDASGKGLSGPAAGLCEWKCPPILKRILWGEWGERTVAATDWCHCWETTRGFSVLATQSLLCGSETPALPRPNGETP